MFQKTFVIQILLGRDWIYGYQCTKSNQAIVYSPVSPKIKTFELKTWKKMTSASMEQKALEKLIGV